MPWTREQLVKEIDSVNEDRARLIARVTELEREHGYPTDAANPNGTTCARLKWWKDRDDAQEDRVAELEKENIALRGIIANLLGEKP